MRVNFPSIHRAALDVADAVGADRPYPGPAVTTALSAPSRALPLLRRTVVGTAAGLFELAALAGVMFALRSHLSVATVGLVLVLPVVTAVVAGGALAGGVTVAAGVLVYDVVFVPPYGSLTVGHPEDWVALAVYVVVMALVTRVANDLAEAETIARARTAEAERLFVLSELLVTERPWAELLKLIVASVQQAFAAGSVVLMLPSDGSLVAVASAGQALTEEEIVGLTPSSGRLASFASRRRARGGAPEETRTIALSGASGPIGVLALTGLRPPLPSGELLRTFANHVALAVERAQLREQTVRLSVLEEVDRLRQAMIGAVSHDLRTPLATIKTSSSALLEPDLRLGESESRELLQLIEDQTDRLARLVSNLLDMSRIESGALVPEALPVDVHDLAKEAVGSLSPAVADRVRLDIPFDLPRVDVDHVFITEALLNLLENALRYGPPGTPVVLDALASPNGVTVRVSDEGPGVPLADRDHLFDRPVRAACAPGQAAASGGTGVGLSITRSFVEAHGGRVFVEGSPTGGARFCFEVPAAPPLATDASA
jgi:two-component system sensor histidine kinase KdpD